MNELSFGAYSLPLVVSLLLRWFYTIAGLDSAGANNRIKQIIPVVLGVGIAYVYMGYVGMAWTIQTVVDNTLYGIINLGFAAIGFYEVTKRNT